MSRRTPKLAESLPMLGSIVQRFRPQILRERRLLVLGLIALLAEVALRLVEPWPLAFVIDTLAREAGAQTGRAASLPLPVLLIGAGCVLLGVVALRAAASYGMTVAFALAGNRVLTAVRAQLYDHLHILSLRFHQSRRTGDLVTRVTGDVGRLQDATVTAMLPLAGNIVTLLGMLVVVLVMDWQLALVALLVFPAFALLGRRSTRRIVSVSRRQRRAEGDLASLATETLGSMAVVQSYSLQSRLRGRFADGNSRALHDGVRAKRLSAGLERSTDVLVGLATAIVLVAGAYRVLAGDVSIGELTVFLTYLKTAFRPLRDIAKYTGRISKAAASGERILEIMDETPDIVDSSWARPAPRFLGRVQFEGVDLSYRPGHPVLRGVDLDIRAGQRVAVVGPSGAGKSSLAGLLVRLRDPDAGTVRIDGHDLRDLTLDSVRAQLAIVLQDSPLFAGTIAENIAFGAAHGASEEEILEAARIAGADGFIRSLPEGYDTVLADRGAGLSGGQRQRIAIARAAVRRAPVVILDEALTGLDPDTESEVIAALYRLTEGRTTLVITHDLAVAADAERAVRIEDGQVRADGPPARVLPGTAA
ncbi:ABC transporter ATP-binding protein [Brachybacterium subflavum]|uniref:ABC transporter ATP-binding protein n=1 Tax=Brachybacterium subflavum TaxID=2585206 RepID=UPI0012660872|nr:ABC transporter ATP-binding protein [Brachybacterium subflavum]